MLMILITDEDDDDDEDDEEGGEEDWRLLALPQASCHAVLGLGRSVCGVRLTPSGALILSVWIGGFLFLEKLHTPGRGR